MRIRTLTRDSFYVNNEQLSGITAIESLDEDLYFHYIKDNSGHYKLSGNTAETASAIIFEDSVTTAIFVTPTISYKYSGQTLQLVVVNQDGVDVISESLFASSNTGITTVSTAGIVSVIHTGSTTITVTHNDGPTGSTAVTGYWPGPVTLTSPSASGTTGTTLQYTLTSTPTSVNLSALAMTTWSSSHTGVTLSTAGLATIAAGLPTQYVNITATYATLTGAPIVTTNQLRVLGT